MTNRDLLAQLLRILRSNRRGVLTRHEAEASMFIHLADYWDAYAASPTRCLPIVVVD